MYALCVVCARVVCVVSVCVVCVVYELCMLCVDCYNMKKYFRSITRFFVIWSGIKYHFLSHLPNLYHMNHEITSHLLQYNT